MQRKLNYKFLLILIVGAAMLTGGLFAVNYFQAKRIAQALLWQANRAEEQGLAERFAGFLKRFLEFEPNAQEERARLAKVWAGDAFKGNVRVRCRAVDQLNKVLLTQPDRADLRRTLIKAALESGMLKEAGDNLTVLIAEDGTVRVQLTNPERGEVETYWGQLLEAENKGADSVGWYRQAISHAPDSQGAYTCLAWRLRSLAGNENDPQKRKANQEEADRLIDELVSRNPKLVQARLARWRFRRSFELIALQPGGSGTKIELSKAAQDVAEALQRSPDAVDVLLAAADVERLKYDFDRAGNSESRQEARRYLTRGLEIQTKVSNAGVYDPMQFQLLWQLTNLLLDEYRDGQLKQVKSDDSALRTEIEGRIAQMRRVRLKPDAVVPAAADYLLARLFIIYEKYSQAETLLVRCRTVLDKQADLAVEINLHLGTCYNHLENPAGMQDAYDRVLREKKGSATALLGMAAAKWKLGQLDESLKFYKALMATNVAPVGGWLDIARIEVQKQLLSEKPRRKWEEADAALGKAEDDVKIQTPGARARASSRFTCCGPKSRRRKAISRTPLHSLRKDARTLRRRTARATGRR